MHIWILIEYFEAHHLQIKYSVTESMVFNNSLDTYSNAKKQVMAPDTSCEVSRSVYRKKNSFSKSLTPSDLSQ